MSIEIETVAIDSITSDPFNVRLHNDRNLEAVKNSLRQFGQQKPIVVKQDGTVIAGNATLAAAKSLGWDEIAIVRTTLDGNDAAAFAIADNRTAELAAWDKTALFEWLERLNSAELLSATGFSNSDMTKFASQQEENIGSTVAPIEYRIVVKCANETIQASLFEQLRDEGYECQLLMS